MLAFLTGCPPEKTAKKPAAVTCHPPKNYVKAGGAAKAGKGQFYFCMKNSKPCIIKWHIKKNLDGAKTLEQEGFATVPRTALYWSTSNCGNIYKSDRNTKT